MFKFKINKPNPKIFAVDFLLLVALGVFGYTTYNWYFNPVESKTVELNNRIVSKITSRNYKDEIKDLKSKYEDVVGILEIPNTDFKRVFVQSKDNSFYLKKNLNKEKDKNGVPFMDYQVNLDSRKLVIYGHNSRYTEMPFNYLMNYYDEDYFNNNKYIDIKTDQGTLRYEVFSVFTETTETHDWSYKDVNFENDEAYEANIENMKNKSIFKKDFDTKDKQILVIQTCSTKKDVLKYPQRFLVIVAGRVNK